jgi:hypothetical protein
MSGGTVLVTAAAALAAWAALPTGFVAAEPLAEVARARVDASLPPHLSVAELHLAARLGALDVDPAAVAIAWPRAPRAGTASVMLTWDGQRRAVPVTLVAQASAPVVKRGTAVTVEVRRGNLRVSARGTLERDSHQGDVAQVRVAPDRPALRGTLVGPALVVIGGVEVTP